ncbi:MAG TPA: response regulator [Opitutaceae bacterium]|nr:response regulator [Opitutaceae bacterium]
MAHTATVTPPADSSSPKSRRVLYAEDMRELREVMRISLTRDGYHIECVVNGEVALQRLTAEPDAFDLVITDHHMPVMNGLEFVTHLRTRPFAGKVIVFSSELDVEVAHEYRKLGVDRILYKPIYPSELRKVLNGVFAESETAA